METEKNPRVIMSIERSARILDAISNGKYTLTEIAAWCKYNKSTVHRLLKALEASGLVEQDPFTRGYYLGILLVQIRVHHQMLHEGLMLCALEEMEKLSDLSEENVSLVISIGIQAIQVHGISSKHDLRISEEAAEARSYFLGSIYRVLFAQLNDEELEKVIDVIDLEKYSEKSTFSKSKAIRQIKQTRKKGYDVGIGEKIPGVVCMAAPVKNYLYPATLAILGPEYRMEGKVPSYTRELVKSANIISRNVARYLKKAQTPFRK